MNEYKLQESTSGAHTLEPVHTPEHMSAPVPTGADKFGQWLTVQEAVAYCQFKQLPRTQKTIRKWASRAAMSPADTAEIKVQRQDTENGFRWVIDRASLDVKIEQERDFEMRAREKKDDAHLSSPVPTGADGSAQVRLEDATHSDVPTLAHPSEPVRTHEHLSAPVRTSSDMQNDQMVEFLMKQIDIKDQQLAVKDRQIETMLERDRETNILIQGLQSSLTGAVQALPGARADHQRYEHMRGDNSESAEVRDALQ